MKVHHMILWFVLMTGLSTMASGTIIITPPERPHPPIRPYVQPLRVRSHEVETHIQEGFAVTKVTQVFYNPGVRLEEGTYLFPLPEGAIVETFSMWINGRETPAELLDAKKAAGIYEDIVRRMKDPALLEFMGSGLFKARVFPIEARSEKKIRLSYRQVLERNGRLFRYQYPLRAAKFAGQSIESWSMRIDLETKAPIKTLFSPSHGFHTVRKGSHMAILSHEAEKFVPNRNVEFLFSSDRDPVGITGLCYKDKGRGFFWLTIVPEVEADRVIPKDLIFILDTSGSMSGDKLEQAKKALRFCINSLGGEDRFEIIRFSTEGEALAGRWLRATETNKHRAVDFVNGFEALGGTNLEDALRLAADLENAAARPQMIVLLTDGKPTIGERDEERLLKRFATDNKGRRIFPFGIGFEINTHLLDRMAKAGGGWGSYIRPDEDLELKLSDFYLKVHSPVMTDLNLSAEGIRLRDLHPKNPPDLFQGQPLHIFGRYDGSGRVKLRLAGSMGGEKSEFHYQLDFPKRDRKHEFIAELWAQRRVGYLLDEIRLHGESDELKEEIVVLAKRYGIVTPYTSYLILEDESPTMRADAGGDAIREIVAPHRERAGRLYGDLKRKSGAAGVAASKALKRMSESLTNLQQEQWSLGALPAKGRPVIAMAAGRAFYRRGQTWSDDSWSGCTTERVQKLVFAGQAYFRFLEDHPELKQVLALGSHIRFAHSGNCYEVVPK